MAPRKKTPVGLFIGLGCLAGLGLLAALVAVGWLIPGRHVQTTVTEVTEEVASTGETPAPSASTTPSAVKTGTPAPVAKPSREQAVRAALDARGEKNWVAKVTYASPDLQRVKVWLGPPQSEYTTEMVLQWHSDQGAYAVESTEPLPALEEPATPPPTAAPAKPAASATPPRPKPAAAVASPRPQPTPVTTSGSPTAATASNTTREVSGTISGSSSSAGPVPSRRRAIAKVLAKAPEPGWVAKVTSHSSDWTEAKILIGPPASEFVEEVSVRWLPAEHKYQIVGHRATGQ